MEEFKKMELVEVKHCMNDVWSVARFICFDPTGPSYAPYIARRIDNKAFQAESYRYCRRKKPDLKMDDPVWVSNPGEKNDYIPRHFADWYGDKIVCWRDGTTSHTSMHKIETWEFYTTEDPGAIK